MPETFLIWGDSGDGKTSLIGDFAWTLFKEAGLRTRLYCLDGGGWGSIQPEVEMGAIEPIDALGAQYPWEFLDEMVAGKVPNQQEGAKPAWIPDWLGGKIGAWAFEGLTAVGDLLLRDLAQKSAKGIRIGGDPPVLFKDGGVTVGGNNQGHYGVVQRRIADLVAKSQLLPGFIIWTALALRATDDNRRITVLGPQLAGKALTAAAPRWFGNTLRIGQFPTGPGKPRERRLYFQDHEDPENPGIKCLAKVRAAKEFPLNDLGYVTPPRLHLILAGIEESQRKRHAQMAAELAALSSTPTAGVTHP